MITLSHDSQLWLSVGQSRTSTSWKNTSYQWSELVNKLATTHHTTETLSEYLSWKKDLQDRRKDIGGFVGGSIHGGRRKADSITSRGVVTLDIDFGTMSFWDDFQSTFQHAACIYSTHKHHEGSPRLRLILPLAHEVPPDEYQAIARKIADLLDIEQFDDTTYQPERLMYWPSTPADQPYYFKYQDGPFLEPERILALYKDWTDVSQWPFSSRRDKAISKAGEKQGEPGEKPGAIGAFCRVYSITEAIETFLSDAYDPVEGGDGDRYTYKHGSTAAGLVVYEDKFAFSHHGTDPAAGRLCNAFDLVRLHKFGKLDNDVKPDTPINKLPSSREMNLFAEKQKAVMQELARKRREERDADFAGLSIDDEVIKAEVIDDPKWEDKLESKKGVPLCTISNCLIILQNHPQLKRSIAYDEFEHMDVVLADLPWRKCNVVGEQWTDNDDAGLRNFMEAKYEIAAPNKIKDAFTVNRFNVLFHPIKQYLESITWDGEKRIEDILIDYFGVENNCYTRAVLKKTLVAAIARIYKPGIKFDSVLTFVGEEGNFKSTFIKKLADPWFSDSLGSIDNPKIYEQLQGVWIIELAELSSFKRSEAAKVKHFVSKQDDRFRVSYGVRAETFKRQCIFIGSTNEFDFLNSFDGNRRFWPVVVNPRLISMSVVKDLTQPEIDQIWAEALQLYKSGESLILSREEAAIAFQRQKDHLQYDDRIDLIRAYLDEPLIDSPGGSPTYRNRVGVVELWVNALGGLKKDMNGKYVRQLMKQVEGWKELADPFTSKDLGRQRGFYRIKPIINL